MRIRLHNSQGGKSFGEPTGEARRFGVTRIGSPGREGKAGKLDPDSEVASTKGEPIENEEERSTGPSIAFYRAEQVG